MSLITARAPGERGIRHWIDSYSYLGGGMTRAQCGLWSASWSISTANERGTYDCPRCIDAALDAADIDAAHAQALEAES